MVSQRGRAKEAGDCRRCSSEEVAKIADADVCSKAEPDPPTGARNLCRRLLRVPATRATSTTMRLPMSWTTRRGRSKLRLTRVGWLDRAQT